MIRAAIDWIDHLSGTRILRQSRLYHSPAWGVEEQPDFINAAVLVGTQLTPKDLLDALLALEVKAGRNRATSPHWGPRILDLDLLLYDQCVIQQAKLTVPHPYLHQRAFVLVPLAEIVPEAIVPGHGQVRILWQRVGNGGLRPLQ